MPDSLRSLAGRAGELEAFLRSFEVGAEVRPGEAELATAGTDSGGSDAPPTDDPEASDGPETA
ncbi:MAG: hypothetical protein V5A23_03015 [Halobacteriales archaeon]